LGCDRGLEGGAAAPDVAEVKFALGGVFELAPDPRRAGDMAA
jgi:hypothetical protein